MKRKSKAPLIVSCVLLILLLVGAVGLLIWQAASNGWVFDKDNVVKGGLIIIGLLISLIRIIAKMGGGTSLKQYEALYQKRIGAAFSAQGKVKYKKALLRAIADYNEDRYESAISKLLSLSEKCDTSDDYNAVLLFLALSYAESGMTDRAVDTYERLVRIYPRNSTAWSNLGLLYRQSGNHERAVACIESALDYDPDNAYAWNNLAQAYLDACEWEKVIEPALSAVRIKNDMYQAETALVVAYFALGESEKSKQYFDRAVLHGASAAKLTSILDDIACGAEAFGEAE